MTAIATSLGEVAVHASGEGSPLVLLHANPGDHRDFDAVVPTLAADHRVYAVDWSGYGDSPAFDPPASTSAMRYASLLPELLDGLAIDRAALIGNSIGGYAAARLAIAHPERVSALVLVNSGGFTRHTPFTRLVCRFRGSEAVTRRVSGIHAQLYLRRRTPVVREMLARARQEQQLPIQVAVDAANWRSFTDPEHDLRQRAASIQAPTLLVWGSRDPNLPLAFDGRRAAKSIPGATLEPVKTGHAPFAEAPDRFLEIVQPFLASATAGPVTAGR